MIALYTRLDDCNRSDNEALTDAIFDWIGDRLCQDDIMQELRRVLPDSSEDDLLILVGAIAWQLRCP